MPDSSLSSLNERVSVGVRETSSSGSRPVNAGSFASTRSVRFVAFVFPATSRHVRSYSSAPFRVMVRLPASELPEREVFQPAEMEPPRSAATPDSPDSPPSPDPSVHATSTSTSSMYQSLSSSSV